MNKIYFTQTRFDELLSNGIIDISNMRNTMIIIVNDPIDAIHDSLRYQAIKDLIVSSKEMILIWKPDPKLVSAGLLEELLWLNCEIYDMQSHIGFDWDNEDNEHSPEIAKYISELYNEYNFIISYENFDDTDYLAYDYDDPDGITVCAECMRFMEEND